ncbi:hypothetical protein M8494_05405 [Serratia ureilytica]
MQLACLPSDAGAVRLPTESARQLIADLEPHVAACSAVSAGATPTATASGRSSSAAACCAAPRGLFAGAASSPPRRRRPSGWKPPPNWAQCSTLA